MYTHNATHVQLVSQPMQQLWPVSREPRWLLHGSEADFEFNVERLRWQHWSSQLNMATHYLAMLANTTTQHGGPPPMLTRMETARLLRALCWIGGHLESHSDALAAEAAPGGGATGPRM